MILAVGRNYAGHAEEVGLSLGQSPSVFLSEPQTLLPDAGDVVLPPQACQGRSDTRRSWRSSLAGLLGT